MPLGATWKVAFRRETQTAMNEDLAFSDLVPGKIANMFK